MFQIYDKNNGRKVTVYAVKEENGVLQFLTYFGEWAWYNASNFYAVQEIDV